MDEIYIILGEFECCIGLGDLWFVVVVGRDRGFLDIVLFEGCRNFGFGVGVSLEK